jgi:hypothetical protein
MVKSARNIGQSFLSSKCLNYGHIFSHELVSSSRTLKFTQRNLLSDQDSVFRRRRPYVRLFILWDSFYRYIREYRVSVFLTCFWEHQISSKKAIEIKTSAGEESTRPTTIAFLDRTYTSLNQLADYTQ